MADESMDTYLNDHLAGAMFGSDLADQICKRNEGEELGDHMAAIAAEIEEDRQTLVDLMERMDTDRNTVKQAGTWIAEKASRPVFSGFTGGDGDLGNLLALESLTLGVEGKASMWKALTEVRELYPPLLEIELDDLVARAENQLQTLEDERRTAAKRAFDDD